MRGTEQTTPQRAGLYLRISDDREGRALGVGRQEKECRELAERRGWMIADVYPDNDVPASNAYTKRKQYERILGDIAAERIDGVIVWDIDRLIRRPTELEHFMELADRHRIELASVGGEVDLATPQGRLTARIKGAVARHETEQQQRRILSKIDQLVEAGLPHVGGGHRPFGYTKNRMQVVDDEAELIREAARRTLAGESRTTVIRDWNDRGIRTTTGRTWTIQALTFMLKSGRIAGLVERRRKVVGPAAWPAIVDMDTHTKLTQLLATKNPGRGPRPRLLLSGLLICGRCGTRMKGHKGHNGRPLYICPPVVIGGCQGVSIKRQGTEEHITRLLLRRIAQLESSVLGPGEVEDPRLARIRELQDVVDKQHEKLAALAAAFADDADADAVEFRDATRLVRERILGTQSEIAQQTARLGIQLDDPSAVVENWHNDEITPPERRREVLAAFIERIVIAPAPRPWKPYFDVSRIDITWQ